MKYRFVIFVGIRTNAGECLKILNTTNMSQMLADNLKGVRKNEYNRRNLNR